MVQLVRDSNGTLPIDVLIVELGNPGLLKLFCESYVLHSSGLKPVRELGMLSALVAEIISEFEPNKRPVELLIDAKKIEKAACILFSIGQSITESFTPFSVNLDESEMLQMWGLYKTKFFLRVYTKEKEVEFYAGLFPLVIVEMDICKLTGHILWYQYTYSDADTFAESPNIRLNIPNSHPLNIIDLLKKKTTAERIRFYMQNVVTWTGKMKSGSPIFEGLVSFIVHLFTKLLERNAGNADMEVRYGDEKEFGRLVFKLCDMEWANLVMGFRRPTTELLEGPLISVVWESNDAIKQCFCLMFLETVVNIFFNLPYFAESVSKLNDSDMARDVLNNAKIIDEGMQSMKSKGPMDLFTEWFVKTDRLPEKSLDNNNYMVIGQLMAVAINEKKEIPSAYLFTNKNVHERRLGFACIYVDPQRLEVLQLFAIFLTDLARASCRDTESNEEIQKKMIAIQHAINNLISESRLRDAAIENLLDLIMRLKLMKHKEPQDLAIAYPFYLSLLQAMHKLKAEESHRIAVVLCKVIFKTDGVFMKQCLDMISFIVDRNFSTAPSNIYKDNSDGEFISTFVQHLLEEDKPLGYYVVLFSLRKAELANSWINIDFELFFGNRFQRLAAFLLILFKNPFDITRSSIPAVMEKYIAQDEKKIKDGPLFEILMKLAKEAAISNDTHRFCGALVASMWEIRNTRRLTEELVLEGSQTVYNTLDFPHKTRKYFDNIISPKPTSQFGKITGSHSAPSKPKTSTDP